MNAHVPAPRPAASRIALRRLGIIALGLLVYFAGWMLVGAVFASTYWYFTGRLPSWLPLP